ncbi:hypothetical protein CGLO_13401 [Colletotrichum gloeosporioides Cg-14]|uniref:Uncharacterized protein n=1 Tax=Colletotrichum gloeosporioides (strain Cg-14) TaxID=1237896 RepID=T0L7A2_COLGC|nr:hypothetical protein CGLO_13401 [Colletotrichum gloeosporioides Cg-14]
MSKVALMKWVILTGSRQEFYF